MTHTLTGRAKNPEAHGTIPKNASACLPAGGMYLYLLSLTHSLSFSLSFSLSLSLSLSVTQEALYLPTFSHLFDCQ